VEVEVEVEVEVGTPNVSLVRSGGIVSAFCEAVGSGQTALGRVLHHLVWAKSNV
jgi:hypothetical protein